MTAAEASMQSIQAWASTHPDRLREMLESNPSVVFFHEQALTDATRGPNGALGVPLTPGRSLAVDTRIIELGVPVFLDTADPLSGLPIERLMMAQDTGGAITTAPGSALRVDFFWGWGQTAANAAGKMRQAGRAWLLLPRP
jgi:membrane-bound lytic murein transglycosylase A